MAIIAYLNWAHCAGPCNAKTPVILATNSRTSTTSFRTGVSMLSATYSPDEASRAALQALTLARETASARTFQEVLRLVGQLQPWRDREPVRELREAVLA
jgi:hypothetical protein